MLPADEAAAAVWFSHVLRTYPPRRSRQTSRCRPGADALTVETRTTRCASQPGLLVGHAVDSPPGCRRRSHDRLAHDSRARAAPGRSPSHRAPRTRNPAARGNVLVAAEDDRPQSDRAA